MAGCDLVLPIYGPPDAAEDAPSDASDASEAGVVNVLANPEFAGASIGCGSPWATINGSPNVTLSLADASYEGGAVCQVCTTVKGLGMVQEVDFGDDAPSTFTVAVAAWVAPPGSGTARVQVVADIHYGDGGRYYLNVPVGGQLVDGGLVLSGEVPKDLLGTLHFIDFNAVDQDVDGGCFFIAAPVMNVLP